MGRKRRQRDKTHQTGNNNIIEDLIESEWDEVPFANLRKLMIRMFND
jgi:hypothetical protein